MQCTFASHASRGVLKPRCKLLILNDLSDREANGEAKSGLPHVVVTPPVVVVELLTSGPAPPGTAAAQQNNFTTSIIHYY